MRAASICSFAAALALPIQAIGTLAVLPGGWSEQVATPFELRCTYLNGPIYPDYRYDVASTRFAWYTLLRERSFTIKYDGNENMVLTSADGEVIRYELGWRDTPPGVLCSTAVIRR